MYKWPIEEQCGYHPITTFWEDFSIADAFGTSAVKDTYKRAFDNWKTDYKYLTELVMVLNWKIWQWYERNPALGELYNELWQKIILLPKGTRRPSWCPLLLVPPHYDLIDHNALKIAVMNGNCETRVDFLKHTMDCINKAPVVIPSDMPTLEAEEYE